MTGRQTAKELRESFLKLSAIPHNDKFYKDVEQFLRATHCSAHRDRVLQNFEKLEAREGTPNWLYNARFTYHW